MKTKLMLVMAAAVAVFTLNNLQPANAQANQQLSNLTSPTKVNQSLQPGTNNSINLGSSTLQWKNLYLSNGLYLKGSLTMHSPGTNNICVGPYAGNTALTGILNTAVGSNALHALTSGNYNTANGSSALYSNTTGYGNTANGSVALYSNTT